jgi:hypothetical protein
MIFAKVQYVRNMIERGYVFSPCLEIGAGLEGANARELCSAHNLVYYGTDMMAGPEVDFVINLDGPLTVIQKQLGTVTPFGSILALNVLEHTFNPIEILDKLFTLLAVGGSCVIITPAVWLLHDYPIDCWRPLPTFYTEYARRRDLMLLSDTFEFVGYGPVAQFSNPDGSFAFPRPGKSVRHRQYSKAVHKLFNTFGRGVFFPTHIAIGVVIKNSANNLVAE